MAEPSKPTDWLSKIPSWLTLVFGLIGGIAAFIVDFREQWQLFTVIIVALILIYLLVLSLYVLLARRRTRSKKNSWIYPFAAYRSFGLIGAVSVCLLLTSSVAVPQIRQFVTDAVLGTPPSLQLEAPDIWIAPFAVSDPALSGAENLVEDDLRQQLDRFGLGHVTVRVEGAAITQDGEAQALLDSYKSKVVIWGWHNELGLQVKLLLSGGKESGSIIPVTGAINLLAEEEPRRALSLILDNLPKDVSFLSLYAIGHLQYLSNNYAAGHRAFDAAMTTLSENADTIHVENEAILHFFQARALQKDGADMKEIVCEYTKAIQNDQRSEVVDVAYNNIGLEISKLYEGDDRFSFSPIEDLPSEAEACLQELQQAGLIEPPFADPKVFFDRAIRANPNLTLARFNRYAFEWMQKPGGENLDTIVSEMEKIQENDGSLIGTYIILGFAKELQNPADAIRMYQLGVARMDNLPGSHATDPKMILLRFNLGQMSMLYQGNVSAAQTEFEQILKSNPGHYETQLALANSYYRQGKFSEAAPYLDAVLATLETDQTSASRRSDAFMLRSAGQFMQGNSPDAINYLIQAIHENPGDRFPHLLLGLLYQVEGKEDLARDSFSRSTELVLEEWDETSGSKGPRQWAWGPFAKNCYFYEEAQTMSFADWALNNLPSSDCMERNLSDPIDRLRAFYDLLSDALLRYRETPLFSLTGAQCPYVYTEDPLTGEWEFDTTILYQVVDHESAQLRPLTQFNGRLLIREQEPEISYINRLYVLAEMADGSFQILEPDVDELKHRDGEYIVLHQGEEILVTLDDLPVTGEVRQWWVMAVGYYSPLR